MRNDRDPNSAPASATDETQKTTVMPATETGAKGGAVRVYDTPARPAAAASPFTRLLPILIALIVLGFLAYRFLRPAATDNTQSGSATVGQQGQTSSYSSDTGSGGAAAGTTGGAAAANGPATANPPGPPSRQQGR